jgi:hypothetical protein
MPIPNLFMVTDAIRNLIASQATIAYAGPVDVTVVSPQEDSGSTNPSVNVYLFHLIEDAHYKNQPQRSGTGPVPIRHVPVGLNLHYVITVRVPESETRVASEHKLLGIVAKIVHDFPIVTQDVLTEAILDDDDRFDLILRPVSLEETINFWAGDDTHVTRPSLFVEARVIQLEPEPPQVFPGIVLSVGTFVVASRGPRLVSSRNQLAFVPPGFGVQRVSAEPARVGLHVRGQDPFSAEVIDTAARDAIRENNRVTLTGSGFGRGHRFLELTRIGDTQPNPLRVVDLEPAPTIPSPDNNVDWAFDVRADGIGLSFLTEVFVVGGAARPMFPGLYSARVVIQEEPRSSTSNPIVFAVVPQVIDVDPTGTPNVYTLDITGSYLNDALNVEVALIVGDQLFERVTTVSAPGQFRVVNGSQLEFMIAPPVAADFPIPVNLTVNGAQATPAWVEGP